MKWRPRASQSRKRKKLNKRKRIAKNRVKYLPKLSTGDEQQDQPLL